MASLCLGRKCLLISLQNVKSDPRARKPGTKSGEGLAQGDQGGKLKPGQILKDSGIQKLNDFKDQLSQLWEEGTE